MANVPLYKEYDVNGLLADFSCAYCRQRGGNWEYLCGGDNSSDPLDSWSDNGYKRPLPISCMGETSDTSFFAKREQRRTVMQCSVSYLGAVQIQQVCMHGSLSY